MFKLNENEKIGKYLSKLITEKYKSQRQFSRKYIEADGGDKNDDRLIDNMSNRISQIVNGKNSVQLSDLPIFTKLLDISCEELLSAGECFKPSGDHLTNYDVAFTDDEDIWEQYVLREDRIILNSDEYGKTIIDYALEFKNIKLLKYFMNHGYIWFVGEINNPKTRKCWPIFGAGTAITRRPDNIFPYDARWHFYPSDVNTRGLSTGHIKPFQKDMLEYTLAGSDDLRRKMVTLAIEYNEVELMHQLCAREIPPLYQLNDFPYFFPHHDGTDIDDYYDEDMIIQIAEASEQILDYFSETFKITNRFKRTDQFLFPYMTNLLDFLIRNNSPYSEKMLKYSIEHNRYAYKRLKQLTGKAVKNYVNYYMQYWRIDDCHSQEELKRYRQREKEYTAAAKENYKKDIYFHGRDNIIMSFYDSSSGDNKSAMVTTVVHTTERSDDSRIDSLIEELNNLYHKICNIKGKLPATSDHSQAETKTGQHLLN